VPVSLRSELGDVRAPEQVESAAYFVVAEALTNVARHSEASHAAVSVARDDGVLVVEVRDDGVGGAAAEDGSGLAGLRDRVGALGGTLVVESPPGGPTAITAVLPCG
jgi:signal transduction histidine kinase